MSDHYKVNPSNACMDTSDFEARLTKMYHEELSEKEPDKIIRAFFQEAKTLVSKTPAEPEDDAIICRYITPSKFISFIVCKEIYFPTANQFRDRYECRLPEDYMLAIFRVATALPDFDDDGMVADLYLEKTIEAERRKWCVSCWTLIDKHYDDHLLFQHHGGPDGIGVTIEYGLLRETISQQLQDPTDLIHGKVDYGTIGDPQMRKRVIFEGEKEVRFCFPTGTRRNSVSLLRPASIDVKAIFRSFGLRFRPDATGAEIDDYRNLFAKFGGDEYNFQHVTGTR